MSLTVAVPFDDPVDAEFLAELTRLSERSSVPVESLMRLAAKRLLFEVALNEGGTPAESLGRVRALYVARDLARKARALLLSRPRATVQAARRAGVEVGDLDWLGAALAEFWASSPESRDAITAAANDAPDKALVNGVGDGLAALLEGVRLTLDLFAGQDVAARLWELAAAEDVGALEILEDLEGFAIDALGRAVLNLVEHQDKERFLSRLYRDTELIGGTSLAGEATAYWGDEDEDGDKA